MKDDELAKLSLQEWQELRRNPPPVCHDWGKIVWDAHDRLDIGNDYDNMPPRWGWLLFAIPLVVFAVLILLGMVR